MAGLMSRLPGFGRRSIISLSIEGNDLRLVCVTGKEIVRFASHTLDPDAMPGGMVTNPTVFGHALRAILAESDIPRGTWIVGFPDSDACSRILNLTKDSRLAVADMVRREMRRDPFLASNEYRLFHQVVEEKTTEIKVFVLAVRRAALTGFLEGLRIAGIAPRLVELRPLALIRAINQPHTIIANVERTFVDVIIVSNYLPMIMRSVPLPEDNTATTEIVNELKRTIDSYNGDHPVQLKARLPLVLTGEMSSRPDLVDALTNGLQRPVVGPGCPFIAPPGFAVESFVVNLGLILKAR